MHDVTTHIVSEALCFSRDKCLSPLFLPVMFSLSTIRAREGTHTHSSTSGMRRDDYPAPSLLFSSKERECVFSA